MSSKVVGGFTFEEWMSLVDQLVEDAFTLDTNHFPDKCYWDMWHDGMSPRDVLSEEFCNGNPEAMLGAML